MGSPEPSHGKIECGLIGVELKQPEQDCKDRDYYIWNLLEQTRAAPSRS
jgi:hypothetical protein